MPTRVSRRQKLLGRLSLIALLTLTGCVTMTGSAGIDPTLVACGAFKPIHWSIHDTDDTIRQIKAHNAAYVAVCGGSSK